MFEFVSFRGSILPALRGELTFESASNIKKNDGLLFKFRLGALAWEPWLRNFGFGKIAWDLSLGIFAWDLSFGVFRLRNLGLGGWGNLQNGAGGTWVASLVCHVFKKPSKNPSR